MEIYNLSYLEQEDSLQNLSSINGGTKVSVNITAKHKPTIVRFPIEKICPLVYAEYGIITHQCVEKLVSKHLPFYHYPIAY